MLLRDFYFKNFSAPKITLLQLFLSLDASSAKCRIVKEKWKSNTKLFNPIKKTIKENRKTNKNILAL